jgi:two-component system cell cycle response regulator DivK
MNKRVLMIEDDREMVTLGKLILEREGYEVLTAHGGEEGLKVLQDNKGKIDLVLLDIMMIGMDGWQVLDSVKSDPELQDVPVIMLTARHYLEDEAETASYADKFAGYVVKPFVVRELLTTIADLVEDTGKSRLR